MTTQTVTELAPWTPVPDAVWIALRTFLEPYIGVRFTVAGDPVPKHRPRLGAGGNTFTSKPTVAAEKVIRNALREELPDWEVEPDWTFGAMVEFRTSSGSTVDIDNTQKLIMDALNTTKKTRGLWLDDIQVGQLYLHLSRAHGEPCTEIALFRVADNGTPPTKICACGTRFRSQKNKCWPCRKPAAQSQPKLSAFDRILALDAADDQLDRERRKVFSFVTAKMIGTNTAPTTAEIAGHVGVTEARARTVINDLIATKNLARDGRRLKVVQALESNR